MDELHVQIKEQLNLLNIKLTQVKEQHSRLVGRVKENSAQLSATMERFQDSREAIRRTRHELSSYRR